MSISAITGYQRVEPMYVQLLYRGNFNCTRGFHGARLKNKERADFDKLPFQCPNSDFCAELAGTAETNFFRTYCGDPETRMLGNTDNLAVVADLSPLTSGHIL